MIYADYNSTSPLAEEVWEKMKPFLHEEFGNPSVRTHRLGLRAREAVEEARLQVARFLDADPEEVIFTSGGTESCAHALLGTYCAARPKKHVICSSVEHPAVLETLKFLQSLAPLQITELPVEQGTVFTGEALFTQLRMETALLSIMLANNETGFILPVAEAVAVAKPRGVVLHTDAVQAAGKMRLSFHELGVDMMSVSAHKFGGPKGAGALLLRHGCPWQPVIRGGGQEQGRRGGTEGIAQIVGMGEAARIRKVQIEQGLIEETGAIRDLFEQHLLSCFSGARINNFVQKRLSNTSSFVLPDVNAGKLVHELGKKDIAVSAGAACKSGSGEPSRSLRQFGLPIADCFSTVRVSFGWKSTKEEAKILAQLVAEEAGRQLRERHGK